MSIALTSFYNNLHVNNNKQIIWYMNLWFYKWCDIVYVIDENIYKICYSTSQNVYPKNVCSLLGLTDKLYVTMFITNRQRHDTILTLMFNRPQLLA